MIPLVIVTVLATAILYGVHGAWREHRAHQERMRRLRAIEEYFGPELVARLTECMDILNRELTEAVIPAMTRFTASMRLLTEAMARAEVVSGPSGKPVRIRKSLHRGG